MIALSKQLKQEQCLNVQETRQMENIEELLDFFLVANDETRRNVTGLMKVFHTMEVSVVLTVENQPPFLA